MSCRSSHRVVTSRAEPEQDRAVLGHEAVLGTGDEQADGEQEEGLAAAPLRHEAAELQALARDGQDQEGEPPATRSGIGWPISQRTFPASQASAPNSRAPVNTAGCWIVIRRDPPARTAAATA